MSELQQTLRDLHRELSNAPRLDPAERAMLEAAVAGLGVAIAPQPLVADDLRAGRLSAPWGFSPTPAALALWVPRRAADGRAEQLAQWLRAELARQGA